MTRSGHQRQRGLSLLELLVAFAIMAIALGMLYKASGSSARSVGEAASYQRAMSLAESLLAMRDAVPAEGWNEAGQSAQFAWRVHSQPYATPISQSNTTAPLLHAVEMVVEWHERDRLRRVELHTLRPQRNIPAGVGIQR
jgi:general secretion pathway protein I